jgi:tetratricopeptide (TPR) repeat protein
MNGRILQDLEDYRSAVRSYREALKRNPDPALAAKIRIDLALCLNNDHDNTGALEALDGISAKDSASASAQLLRAEALVGLGRNAEAAELLDAAIKRYPEVGGLHHLRGGLYLNMGDSKAAAASLERAIALNPGEYRPRYQLALAFEQLGRTKEAAEQRSKADQTKNDLLELSKLNREAMKDPWDAEVRYKLADACERLHMPQLAAMWRKAAKACPKK